MNDLMSSVLVPLYFIHATLGTAVIAWWFKKQSKPNLKAFGLGMMGYSLGLLVWTVAVIMKPADLKPFVLLGVIPFLLAHLAYAKVAGSKLGAKASSLMALTVVLLAATFVARTFFYPSEPYISGNGLLFFGLMPIPVALYIATISVTFLPAIRTAVGDLKQSSLKAVMGVGLTVLYVCSIILVSAKDDTLLTINGAVMSFALLTLWVKALSTKAKS